VLLRGKPTFTLALSRGMPGRRAVMAEHGEFFDKPQVRGVAARPERGARWETDLCP
jgi:hypothetical protein